MRRRRPLLVLIPALAVGLLLLALAAPRTARAGAKLTVPGTYATLGEAVSVAQPGDTIEVTGTIVEAVTISGKTGITISGKGATLQGLDSINCITMDLCQDITIAGLTFRNPSGFGIALSDSAQVTLSRCVFTTIGIDALMLDSCSDVLVTGCTFDDLRTGVVDDGSDHLRVSKCTFRNLRGVGVAFSPSGTDDSSVTRCTFAAVEKEGVHVAGRNVQVSGNAFSGIGSAGIVVGSGPSVSGVVVSKNLITDTAQMGIYARSDTRVEKNTIASTGTMGVLFDGDGGTVIGNRVHDTGDQGLSIVGSSVEVSKNSIAGAGANGIYLPGTLVTLAKNKVTGSSQNGLLITGTSNNVTGNTFADSGPGYFDILSNQVPDMNVFGPNKYATAYFPSPP